MKWRDKKRRLLGSWWLYGSLLLVGTLSLIFAYRYKAAFSIPNFYAEDGTVFLQNILQKGVVGATLTAFNGYLIAGQYIIIDCAYIIDKILGLPFRELPVLIAGASCVFLGLTASLPFILFRKELGLTIALITSVLIAFTPLYGSDYAVIGTIGNLKFAFLFWAVLFILYRNIHYRSLKRVIFSDLVLFLCVITNGPVVALLPAILWPYRKDLWHIVKHRKLKLNEALKQYSFVSMVILAILSFAYLLVVYLKGIPKIPNYLDGPYTWNATGNIIYRVTEYAWLYPVSKGMTTISAMVVLGIILALALLLNRHRRIVFLFGIYAISIGTLAFVATRPGIGQYMLNYEKFPDQFFYAQSMIFVFITMWVIAPYVKTSHRQALTIGLTAIFLFVSVPYGSSYGVNRALYDVRPTIYDALSEACHEKTQDVTFPIYPNGVWNMTVNRTVACS